MNKLRYIMIFFVIVGVCFLIYPTIATYISDYTSTKMVVDYDQQLENLKQAELDKLKNSKKDITLHLKDYDFRTMTNKPSKKKSEKTHKQEQKSLRELKTEYKKGEWIGNVIIDKVEIYLPLYVGTHDSVLMKGAGHLEGTSLPIGGKGTHAVITSHSGIASASLFNRLHELKKGDTFLIQFLDEDLYYEVDQIVSVEPDKGDAYIQRDPEQDYVTLITCVPVTYNTHRLLVRGHRIQITQKNGLESFSEPIKDIQNSTDYTLLIICSIIILMLLLLTHFNRKRSNNKSIH